MKMMKPDLRSSWKKLINFQFSAIKFFFESYCTPMETVIGDVRFTCLLREAFLSLRGGCNHTASNNFCADSLDFFRRRDEGVLRYWMADVENFRDLIQEAGREGRGWME